MLKRQTQIKLIKYELDHIRYFNKTEEELRKIFGNMDWVPNLPCNDFELLEYVLDDIGVPPDSGYAPRDDYFNLYSELYWSKSISNGKIDAFIEDVISLMKKKEKKK